MTSTILARLKSPLASKINIAQAVGLLASIVAVWGIDVPPEMQAQIVVAITSAIAVVTWILRTWFTTAITPQSAERMRDLNGRY